MIKITDEARDKIKEVLVENPGKSIRITVEGMG
jgi:Fe-S cluster assembly iron-binding protein IscA